MDLISRPLQVGSYFFISSFTSGSLKGFWKAHKKETDLVYVIKTLLKSEFTDPNKKSLLLKEIYFLKKLKHPNIAEYIDLIEDNDFFHLIFQSPENISLKEFINNKNEFKEENIRPSICRILSIMEYLNQNFNFNYSNINQNNIFLDKNNLFSLIFIQNSQTLIFNDNDIENLSFIPPEIISGSKPTINSDIYYEMDLYL